MQNSKVKQNPSIMTLGNHEQLRLEQLMPILRQDHDEKTVKQLVRQFCLETTSDDIRKKGMEFLYMNGYYDDLQRLVIKNKSSVNPSNRKWAEVYQLTLDRKRRRYSGNEILKHAIDMQTDEPELKSLLEFIKLAVFYGRNEYGKLGNILEKQQYLFEKIHDNFLLEFFQDRLNRHLFVYYLVRNEVIMARKYAFRMLTRTTDPKTIINLHMGLGLSYMYDTYYQGMYHLREGLKLAREQNLHRSAEIIEQQNIPFLSAHFKKVEGIRTTDKSEQAHIEIAKRNFAKAEAILSELEINTPFRMYYLGLAKQDKSLLLQSYNQFIVKRSDYFFSRLPLNALQKMND